MSTPRDFVGFTYNGIHSSDLNLLVTSSSNRYNDNLIPTLTETTVDNTGADGAFYFGTRYKTRTFTVNVAFDGISEENLHEIRLLFSGKEIHDLIFDDEPYKVWSAKVTGKPNLKYVCFDTRTYDSTGAVTSGSPRVYKGEGSINFICYYPYAHTQDGKLTRADYQDYANYEEWNSILPVSTTTGVMVNYGDIPMPFTFKWTGIETPTLLNTVTGTYDSTFGAAERAYDLGEWNYSLYPATQLLIICEHTESAFKNEGTTTAPLYTLIDNVGDENELTYRQTDNHLFFVTGYELQDTITVKVYSYGTTQVTALNQTVEVQCKVGDTTTTPLSITLTNIQDYKSLEWETRTGLVKGYTTTDCSGTYDLLDYTGTSYGKIDANKNMTSTIVIKDGDTTIDNQTYTLTYNFWYI